MNDKKLEMQTISRASV